MSTQPVDPDAQDTYRVRWEIDLCATSPLDAAQLALAIQRDPASIATHFKVTRHGAPASSPATIVDFHDDTYPAPAAEDTVSDARRRRFNDILDGYECGAGDWTMPTAPLSRDRAMRALPADRVPTDGADAAHYLPGRYALVCESTRGHGYFVTNLTNRGDLDTAVADTLNGGWQPVCYLDLDVLAGDEPLPDVGDLVCLLGDDLRTPVTGPMAGTWYIVDHNGTDDDGDGPYRKCDLAREAAGDAVTWQDTDHLRVLERAEPDTRMPARYGLSRITIAVAFNTIPSP